MLKSVAKSIVNRFSALAGPQRWPLPQPRLWVLMYHRVLPRVEALAQREEPGMYVTPETFDLHLCTLVDGMTPVSLSDWVQRRADKQPLPHRAVAITFDDGWRDNYTHAWPVLKKYSVPATIFAVSGMIGTKRTFWPNRLMQLLSERNNIGEWPSGLEWLTDVSPVKPEQLTTPEALSDLVQACKRFSDIEMYKRLDALPETTTAASPMRTMLDWDEIREMQASGLVEIGSHTENHCRLLESLDAEIAGHEILASKRTLEDRLGGTVQSFCYPNGDVSALAARLVGENYRLAVTTQRGINGAKQDPYRLKRIGLHEDVANTRTAFLARLSGWR